MPPVIGAAVILLVEVGFSFATAIAITGAVVSFAVSTLVQAGIGLLTASQSRKSTAPSVNRLEDVSRFLTQSSIESHKVIYGTARMAGNVSFRAFSNSGNQKAVGGAFTTDTQDNLYQHTIICLAGHECEEITSVYLDDTLLCNHYGNTPQKYEDKNSFSPHYSDGATLLVIDPAKINELFILTDDEKKVLFSIEKPTIKVTILD
jgi:hypothetical protein